jgi:hypothetical protein
VAAAAFQRPQYPSAAGAAQWQHVSRCRAAIGGIGTLAFAFGSGGFDRWGRGLKVWKNSGGKLQGGDCTIDDQFEKWRENGFEARGQ